MNPDKCWVCIKGDPTNGFALQFPSHWLNPPTPKDVCRLVLKACRLRLVLARCTALVRSLASPLFWSDFRIHPNPKESLRDRLIVSKSEPLMIDMVHPKLTSPAHPCLEHQVRHDKRRCCFSRCPKGFSWLVHPAPFLPIQAPLLDQHNFGERYILKTGLEQLIIKQKLGSVHQVRWKLRLFLAKQQSSLCKVSYAFGKSLLVIVVRNLKPRLPGEVYPWFIRLLHRWDSDVVGPSTMAAQRMVGCFFFWGNSLLVVFVIVNMCKVYKTTNTCLQKQTKRTQ